MYARYDIIFAFNWETLKLLLLYSLNYWWQIAMAMLCRSLSRNLFTPYNHAVYERERTRTLLILNLNDRDRLLIGQNQCTNYFVFVCVCWMTTLKKIKERKTHPNTIEPFKWNKCEALDCKNVLYFLLNNLFDRKWSPAVILNCCFCFEHGGCRCSHTHHTTT